MDGKPARAAAEGAAGPVPAVTPAASEPAVGGGRVVVGVDDTPGGLAALRYAVALARSRGAQLVAVRCWALGLPRHGGRRHRHGGSRLLAVGYTGTLARETAAEIVRQVFRDAVGGMPCDLAVRIETPHGDPGAALVSLASRDTDMLVVGRRPGHPASRAVHGSVARYCNHYCRCPVVAVPPDEPGSALGLRRTERSRRGRARGSTRRA
jgi:nucleotide-binding universal stress UspA family protein